MTIAEQLALTDATVPNTCLRETKIAWLNTLDHLVYKEVLLRHEGAEALAFEGYNADTDENTELLVSEPYCEMYGYWIEAKIHYLNGDYGRYANARTMFNSVYSDFGKWYAAEHKPQKQTRWKLF